MSGRFSSPEPSPEKTPPAGCSPPREAVAGEIPVLIKQEEPLLPIFRQEPLHKAPEKKRKRRSKRKEKPKNMKVPAMLEKSPETMSTGKFWANRPTSFRPGLDSSYQLPDGWTKTVVTRKSGVTNGSFDVYLIPPGGKRLRSAKDIYKFVLNNPDVPLDPNFVNMEPPVDENGQVIITNKTEKFIDDVASIKATGTLPESWMRKRKGEDVAKVPEVSDYIEYVGPEGQSFITFDAPEINQPKVSKKKKELERREDLLIVSDAPIGVEGPTFATLQVVGVYGFTSEKEKRLEKLLDENNWLPSLQQVQMWSSTLFLDVDEISAWIRERSQKKIKEEAVDVVKRMRDIGDIPQEARIKIPENNVPYVYVHPDSEIQLQGTPETWPKMENSVQEVVTLDSSDDEVKVENVYPLPLEYVDVSSLGTE